MVAPNEKIKVDLSPFEETMLIPLWARGAEVHEDPPILCDEEAARLVDRLDYDFSILTDRMFMNSYMRTRFALRSVVMDEYVQDFLTLYPRATIVELGCGLSTRFERVDNGELQWYCLDLPDAMRFREKLVPATERCENMVGSMLEKDWISRVLREEGPWMIVIEGVLPYFEEEQVKCLFKMLCDYFGGGRLVFDTQTELYRRLIKPGKLVYAEDSDSGLEFQWVVRDIHEIEKWDDRLELLETQTTHDMVPRANHRIPLKIRMLEGVSKYWWGEYRLNVFEMVDEPVKD
ncbi:class I SAM-dependent methyltransferase [Planctomycetota bacterium]|nr:class I SAM-dependent methyltransferase [Planctomycetota bacterium]